MRYYLLTIHVFILSISAPKAQDFIHNLDGISKVIIKAENDIQVMMHDQTTLRIKESTNDQHKKSKKAKGLKLTSSKGNDNTGLGIEIKQENSHLVLLGLLDRKASALVIHLPKSMNIYVESLVNSDITINGFESEIEAKNHTGDIFLTDLTGPIVAENVNGDVSIVFSELSQKSPTSIVVVNGNIEIEMSKHSKANITSKITGGEFYTDFEMNPTIKRKANTRSITGKINKGGVEVFLRNLEGNIYLKKGH